MQLKRCPSPADHAFVRLQAGHLVLYDLATAYEICLLLVDRICLDMLQLSICVPRLSTRRAEVILGGIVSIIAASSGLRGSAVERYTITRRTAVFHGDVDTCCHPFSSGQLAGCKSKRRLCAQRCRYGNGRWYAA